MHRHTNRATAFASPSPTTITGTSGLVVRDTRALLRAVLKSELLPFRRLTTGPHRHKAYRLTRDEARSCPVEGTVELLIAMRDAGYAPARLEQVVQFLDTQLRVLLGTLRPRPLDKLDLEESHFEAIENRLAEQRHLYGADDAAREAEAAALEAEAALGREKAVALRRVHGRLAPPLPPTRLQ